MTETSTALSSGKEISFAEVPISPKQTVNVTAFSSESPVEAIRPVAVIKNADISIALTNEISEGLLSRILLEVAHASRCCRDPRVALSIFGRELTGLP